MELGRWSVRAVLPLALGLTACSGTATTLGEAHDEAATVSPVKGTDVNRLTLAETAYARLAVETKPVRRGARAVSGSGAAVLTVPSAAVLYDAQGQAWAYVVTGPRTFVRTRVVVDHFDGATAYLNKGPRPGTAVVTVGVPELFGAEEGVEGE